VFQDKKTTKQYFRTQVFTDVERMERAREKIKGYFRKLDNGDADAQPRDCAERSVSKIVVILIGIFFYSFIFYSVTKIL
jgi:hypothetical protein